MKKLPLGIIFFSSILIITSILQLFLIPPKARYYEIHQSLPEPLILVRFVMSYCLRLFGLVVGVGLIRRKELFRKLAFVLGYLILATLYIRHPYYVFAEYTQPIFAQSGIESMSLSTFTWISVGIRWLVDGVFALGLILYLNNQKIQEIYK